jgi:hypothetical protein
MRLFSKITLLILFSVADINSATATTKQAGQIIYAGNFSALISAPPGWVNFPSDADADKMGVLALYKLENKSINEAQILIQVIPMRNIKNMLEIQIQEDKKRNLKDGAKLNGTKFLKTSSGIQSAINFWAYPTNNNSIGIVPSDEGVLIVGGYSMKKEFDKKTQDAVQLIMKNVKFINRITPKY